MMLRLLSWLAALALFAGSALAVTTNDPATAILEGQELAAHLRTLRPAQNLTNTGTLKLRGNPARRGEAAFTLHTFTTETNWQAVYRAETTNPVAAFTVIHSPEGPSTFNSDSWLATNRESFLLLPFAGSDFQLLDLGAEFFHWPDQRLVKRELKKGQSCDVLESRPAAVAAGGYSRVVSWIDRDTGGIVQAEAYDPKGRLLKEFEVKEFRKVNGEWRVTELQMRNVQAKSNTVLVFQYVE